MKNEGQSTLIKTFTNFLIEGSGGIRRLSRKAKALRRDSLRHADMALEQGFLGFTVPPTAPTPDILLGLANLGSAKVHKKLSDSLDKQAIPVEARIRQKFQKMIKRQPVPYTTDEERADLTGKVGLKMLKQAPSRLRHRLGGKKTQIDPQDQFSTREGVYLSATTGLARIEELENLAQEQKKQSFALDLIAKMNQGNK